MPASVNVLPLPADGAAPAVGEKAVPSDNPTVADAPAEQITTSRPPDTELEIVDEVRRRVSPSKTRFIHVEVYRDNDPAKGVNRYMAEWGLPSEPWIFVVDSAGVIRERFAAPHQLRSWKPRCAN